MSDDNQPNEDGKIVIDDDWKSQVETEKQTLKKEEDPAPTPDGQPELPPASFLILLSTLATQSMACLGLIPDPSTGEPQVNRPMAKHFIDTLAMLQDKTKGNLEEEENAHLRDALHQLRMAYVSTENLPSPEQGQSGDSPDSGKPSSIVMP